MSTNRKEELRSALEKSMLEAAQERKWTEGERNLWITEQVENYCRRWLQMTKGLSADERFSERNDLWTMVLVGFDVADEAMRGEAELGQQLADLYNELRKDPSTMTAEGLQNAFGEIGKKITAQSGPRD